MNHSVTLLKSTPEARDLRAEVAALQAADQKLTQAEISRQSGVGSTALSQWINGRYPGDNERLEADLARWIDAHNTRTLEAKALPKAPDWVSIPTSERILAAYSYAQLAGDIALVYGGAGVSKTYTAEHYQRAMPNVWIATMSSDTKAVVSALEEVTMALGLSVRGGAATLRREVARRVRGTMGLLIIDEAQHLGIDALESLRAVHDKTGIGLVLQGNESVYAHMTGGNRAAYLDRLFSRIGKRVRVTRSTKGDIDALIDAWRLDPRECRAALHDIAGKPGGLRGLTKVLRLASMFAAGDGRSLSCTDIKAAWRDLGGE